MTRRMTCREARQWGKITVQIPYGCGERPNALFQNSRDGYNFGIFGWNWDFWGLWVCNVRVGFVSGYRIPKTLYDVQVNAAEFDKIENMAHKLYKSVGTRHDRITADMLIDKMWADLLTAKGVIFE